MDEWRPGRSTHEVTLSEDGTSVRKRFRSTSRNEHVREWSSLRLLHRYAPGLAPEPLTNDFNAAEPTILMQRIHAGPLGGPALSAQQVALMIAALERLHDSVPVPELEALPKSSGDYGRMFASTRQALAGEPRPADEISADAYESARRWLDDPEAAPPAETGPDQVFGRGDQNLSNFLWDGTTIRLIDFEDAGRSDRAGEYSELVEHISARSTPDHIWDTAFSTVDFSESERRWFLINRRLLAIFWFAMLLPGRPSEALNPPGTLQRQGQRLVGRLNGH